MFDGNRKKRWCQKRLHGLISLDLDAVLGGGRRKDLQLRPGSQHGREEWKPLNVIPVQVGYQRGALKWHRWIVAATEEPQAGAKVTDDRMLTGLLQDHAGRIAAVALQCRLAAGRRAPNPVKRDVERGVLQASMSRSVIDRPPPPSYQCARCTNLGRVGHNGSRPANNVPGSASHLRPL